MFKKTTGSLHLCFTLLATSCLFSWFNLKSWTVNHEQKKCRLMNEYPFFLLLIGRWYYENISCFERRDLFQQVLIYSLQFPVWLVYALARVYSCLQNGDVLLNLSCLNWYDNNKIFLINKWDKVSIFLAVNCWMALLVCQYSLSWQ